MDSNYIPVYPDGEIHESIKAFISRFYQVSDDPDQNETWVQFFENDATLVMGLKMGKGQDGSSTTT